MRRLLRLVVVLIAIGFVAAACGDDSEGGTDVAGARDVFCTDVEALIGILDEYGMILGDGELTVGSVRATGEELAAARAGVEESADKLREQLDAAEEAGEEIPDDLDVDDETIDFVRKAEESFDEALDGISDDTPLTEAAVIVTSASFQFELAWIALLDEAGCVDSDSFAAQVIEYVKATQTDLTAAGLYEGEIDGIYGPETIAAVEALQEQAGLEVTGLMDPATQVALAELLEGQESAQISALQGLMTATGYYTGPIDGIPSDALTDSVKALQADAGLEATGSVDSATLRAIQAAIAAAAPPSTESTEPPTESTEAPTETTEAPTETTEAPTETTEAPTETTEAPAEGVVIEESAVQNTPVRYSPDDDLPWNEGDVTSHWYTWDGSFVVVYAGWNATDDTPLCPGNSVSTAAGFEYVSNSPSAAGGCDPEEAFAANSTVIPIDDALGARVCSGLVIYRTLIPVSVDGTPTAGDLYGSIEKAVDGGFAGASGPATIADGMVELDPTAPAYTVPEGWMADGSTSITC